MMTADPVSMPPEIVASVQVKSFIMEDLLDSVVQVVKASQNPNAQVRVEDHLLRIVAGDETKMLSLQTGLVKVNQTGSFEVPGKKLHAICARSAGGDMALAMVGAAAVIKTGSRMWALPATAKPLLLDQAAPPSAAVVVDADLLAEATQRVREAGGGPGVDAGVHLGDGTMSVLAGPLYHRRSVAGMEPITCSLPWSCLLLLSSLLRHGAFGALAHVAYSGGFLHVWGSTAYLRLSAQPGSSDPPAWAVQAMANAIEMHVDRHHLVDALRATTVNQKDAVVALSLSTNNLLVTAKDGAGHSGQEDLDVGWPGPDVIAMFKATPLLNMLKSHTGSGCEFRLSGQPDHLSPAWLLKDTDRTSVLRQTT
jgi:hypothetical protein